MILVKQVNRRTSMRRLAVLLAESTTTAATVTAGEKFWWDRAGRPFAAKVTCNRGRRCHSVIVVYDTETVMFLHVDPDSGLAIYDQIVRQIKFAVATGALPAGETVPSVRERCWKRPLRIERFNLAAASWTPAADRARLELLSRCENLEFTFMRSIPTRVLCNARSRERKRTESGSSSNRLIRHESGKPFPKVIRRCCRFNWTTPATSATPARSISCWRILRTIRTGPSLRSSSKPSLAP